MKPAKVKKRNKKNFDKWLEKDIYITEEVNKWRIEKRTTKISYPYWINIEKWCWVKTIINIHREIINKWILTIEDAYFISSLEIERGAKFFWDGIRAHRGIESFHYIKDVTMKEDDFKVKNKDISAIYAILRDIAINIFRKNSMNFIKAAIEKCANRPKLILSLI